MRVGRESELRRSKAKKERTDRPVLVYDGDLFRLVSADAFFSLSFPLTG